MAKYLIIGGGLTGVCAANLLAKKGLEFEGLEKEERLGGRAEIGHHRIYSSNSVEFLSRFSTDEWFRIDDEPKERKKGEWSKVADIDNDCEEFYLGTSYYYPKSNFSHLLTSLIEPVRDTFHLNKTVEKVDAGTKTVTCQDGTTYQYETLLWCTHIDHLRKVWQGDNSHLLKALKKTRELHAGISLDVELKAAPFEFKNSVVFNFRYKDNKMRAIGVQDSMSEGSTEHSHLHWLLFVDEEICEDREELAKCVRTMKREILKEFPEMKDLLVKERIVFLPALSGDESAELKSLELVPSVFYLGPQVSLPGTDASLRNIDRSIDNCAHFEQSLSS